MNQTLRSAGITVVITALIVVLLLLGASAIAYMNEDPNALLYPLSLAVLVIGGMAAGGVSVRMIGGAPALGALIGAGILLLFIAFMSLFFRNGEAIKLPKVLLTIAIVIASAFAGALIAKPRAADPMKRRKKLEHRFTN